MGMWGCGTKNHNCVVSGMKQRGVVRGIEKGAWYVVRGILTANSACVTESPYLA
jgi:hypothetical protein